MTKTAHTPNLKHSEDCALIPECQNSHSPAKNTAKPLPIRQSSKADTQPANASYAEPITSRQTGRGLNLGSSNPTAENVPAVEKQSQNSSPLITQKETDAPIGMPVFVAINSTSGLKRETILEMATVCFASTATVQEVNLGDALTSCAEFDYIYYIPKTENNMVFIKDGTVRAVIPATLIAAAPDMAVTGLELLDAAVDYAKLVQVENFNRNDMAVHRAYERLRLAGDAHRAALAKAGVK